MKYIGQGKVPAAYIDSNLHVNIKHYVGIISDGTHQFVASTDLKKIIDGKNKSFVITKMSSSFHKEMKTNDEWILFAGIYKINLSCFSLVYDLKVKDTRVAKFHARCNYFNLSTRKSFQIDSEVLANMQLEIINLLHDPLLD